MEMVRYFGRRKSDYRRIDESGHGRRRRTVVLGNGSSRRRRLWRVRPRIGVLKLVATPKRFFTWLRDAYVKMMLGFAESSVVSAAYGGSAFGNAGIGKSRLKEYDEKMILEIYKSIVMAQGHAMVPRAAGKLGPRLSPVKE